MIKLGRRIQCGLLSYDTVQTDSWLHTTSNSTRRPYSAYGGSRFTLNVGNNLPDRMVS